MDVVTDTVGSAAATGTTEAAAGDKRVLLAAPAATARAWTGRSIAVEKALELYGAPVYVRKQIVHNRHVVPPWRSAARSSSTRPTRCPRAPRWCSPRTASPRSCTRRPRSGSLQTIDATCPLVTKVHHEAVRFAADDFDILLIGHEGHEEVVGTAGEAPEHIHLVERPGRRRPVDRARPGARSSGSRRPRCRSTRRWRPCGALRERFPQLQDPPSDDICYATQNRQVAVKQIAPQADLVIVVGSRNSSNSVPAGRGRAGARRQGRLPGGLRRRDRRGLAGRRRHGRRDQRRLACPRCWSATCSPGWPSAATTTSRRCARRRRDLLFSLPKELRRDLKAAEAAQAARATEAAGPAAPTGRARAAAVAAPACRRTSSWLAQGDVVQQLDRGQRPRRALDRRSGGSGSALVRSQVAASGGRCTSTRRSRVPTSAL